MFNYRPIRMGGQADKADLLKWLHYSGRMLVLPNNFTFFTIGTVISRSPQSGDFLFLDEI